MTSPSKMKRYYTITEVSKMLDRSRQALNYWARWSGVKKTKEGYKFTVEDIEVMKIRLGIAHAFKTKIL